MKQNHKNDITDEDIDNLFLNDCDSVLDTPESDITTDEINSFVPDELSIDPDKNVAIDRPELDPQLEKTRISKEIKEKVKIEMDLIKTDIHSVKQVNGFEQAKEYIKQLRSFNTISKLKDHYNREIISGVRPTHTDEGTPCKFHIFQPVHILGDTVYTKCKFCSVTKDFTQNLWDEYCIKYRKWF